MRIVNRLLDERMKKKPVPPAEPDEVEITMHMPAREPLNTSKSVFDRGVAQGFGGINSQPSVFDRGAAFKPNGSE